MNVMGDGMVAAVGDEPRDIILEDTSNEQTIQSKNDEDTISDEGKSAQLYSEKHFKQHTEQNVKDLLVPVQGRIDKLLWRTRQSIWLLAYIAIITTWPFVGSLLLSVLKKRFKTLLPATLLKR